MGSSNDLKEGERRGEEEEEEEEEDDEEGRGRFFFGMAGDDNRIN